MLDIVKPTVIQSGPPHSVQSAFIGLFLMVSRGPPVSPSWAGLKLTSVFTHQQVNDPAKERHLQTIYAQKKEEGVLLKSCVKASTHLLTYWQAIPIIQGQCAGEVWFVWIGLRVCLPKIDQILRTTGLGVKSQHTKLNAMITRMFPTGAL